MSDSQTREIARNTFIESANALLAWGDPNERIIALSVIGALGNVASTGILLHVLEHDSQRQVRHKASQAIARIGGSEAIEALQRLMRHEDAYTRFLAAEALANIVAQGTT
ncbi:MAG: HEAT repeat domain-containing protein [Phototrophicaceae bacterium]